MNIFTIACTWVILFGLMGLAGMAHQQGVVIVVGMLMFILAPVTFYFFVRGVMRWMGKQWRHDSAQGH